MTATILPAVPPVDRSLEPALLSAIGGKAMPRGALGRLEALAVQIGLARGNLAPPPPSAHVLVFCADHGIALEGVTAYPSGVTREIARLAASGRAGINCCAAGVGIGVSVIDAGLLAPTDLPAVADVSLRRGTSNALQGPAMSTTERDAMLERGSAVGAALVAHGIDTLVLGEAGIGNTTAAALVGHAVTGVPLERLIGPGAGVPPRGLRHKLSIAERAFERAPTQDALAALAEFGGFEIVAMVGAMTGAAASRALVLVDGFIATAAAAAAVRISPALRDYLVFAHRSDEPGHGALLEALDATPLLDLGLRLGEGTGAALAVPLVRAATALLSEMADLTDVLASLTATAGDGR